jgi:hypothetical protein
MAERARFSLDGDSHGGASAARAQGASAVAAGPLFSAPYHTCHRRIEPPAEMYSKGQEELSGRFHGGGTLYIVSEPFVTTPWLQSKNAPGASK